MNKTPVDDAEYEAKIAEILASYAEDPEVAIQALAELDTELVSAPTTVEHGNASCTRATYPSDYELTDKFQSTLSTVDFESKCH